jgi:hypothetical protein
MEQWKSAKKASVIPEPMNLNYERNNSMTLFKKIPFTIDRKEYEVRILYDPGLINIAVFINNRPATGFRHHIQIPKSLDVKEVLEKKLAFEVIKELIQIAKEDIAQQRWERLIAGIGV